MKTLWVLGPLLLWSFKAEALIIGGIAGANWLVTDVDADPAELREANSLPQAEASDDPSLDDADLAPEQTEAD